jgi:hypothetical protein
MRKKLHIKILVLLFLIISDYTIGQSTLNVTNGGKMKVTSGISVQIRNMEINGNSEVVNRGYLTVSDNLVNNAGNQGLIMKADQTGYGSLLHNTAGVPAMMEQYLTSQRWHLVSSPMTNAAIETYLDIYLKKWNEADSSWTYLVQPVTLQMEPAAGYSAWASDDLTGTTTVYYEGTLNNGDYAVSLDYTPASSATGWNLIGNPYPSAIDWNLDNSWNRNSVGGWAVVYDSTVFRGWNPYLTGNDRSFNGKSDGIIPATQGFWVRATAAGASLTIPQSLRTHNNQPFYKDSEESGYMSLRLKVTVNGYTDETVIIFMDNATEGFDGLFDLEKHYNIDEAPNLSSNIGGMEYSVNVLPGDFVTETESPVIPVNFKLGVEQECTVAVSGVETFNPLIPVYLEDLKEDVMINLHEQLSYTFSSTPLDNPGRFLLHFGESLNIDENVFPAVNIYSHKSSVYVEIQGVAGGEAEVFDIMGRTVCSFRLNSELTKKVLYRTGYYIVKAETENGVTVKKVFIKS